MREPWAGFNGEPRKWQREALPVVLDALRRRVPGIVSAVMGAGKSRLQAEIGWMALEKLGDRAIVLSAPKQSLVRQLSRTVSERCGEDNVGCFYADAKEHDRRIVVACNDSLLPLAQKFRETGRRVALFIPDEAHGSESETMIQALDSLEPLLLCGFTATPFRSVPKERLSRFKEVLYRYTMEDALRDKVLVPMRHVRYIGEDPGSVDEECLAMIRKDGEGPGIVSANCIDDAEGFAVWLTERDVPAMPIHSRMNEWERARRLEALQEGGVRCLVHVSLLSEGVDLPWLRWLCLRRKTEARVRFLQEVGRPMRAYPGKTECVVMDPHMLLGRHGLISAEAIGQALEQAALAGEREEAARNEQGLTEPEVVALDALTGYLAVLRNALEERGVVGERYKSPDGDGWRFADVSQKQVDRLAGLRKLTRHIPAGSREPVKALVRIPWALTSGQASDLMDVLIGGSQWAKAHAHGREPFMVQWPKWYSESLEVPDAKTVKVASKIKGLDS